VKPTVPLSYNRVDAAALADVLQRYAGRHHDDLITDFEQQLAAVTGSPFAVALNSGTAAIHLGLKALGVGPGDVVIASTFTYVATINPIRYLGAVPVFVDSNPDDWNMSPVLLREAIEATIQAGAAPKAILIVHTYGMPANMQELIDIATSFGIPVLEDAAEALGSTYVGRQVGTFGAVGVLSFNNNKLVTTYGGGALLTRDAAIADKINRWANQSRDNFPHYEHQEIGYNYRMGPLNAAMGLTQLATLSEKVTRRRAVFAAYRHRLGSLGWQEEAGGQFSNRWLTTVLLPADANRVRCRLQEVGVEARLLWKPMHLQPVFGRYRAWTDGTAERLFAYGLSLPSGEGAEGALDDIAQRLLMP